MTITKKDVADLREGDEVEMRFDEFPDVVLSGRLHQSPGGSELRLGGYIVRDETNGCPWDSSRRTLTVVSRASRPLYVNHDRTEPVPGDVVRDADSDDKQTWMFGPRQISSTFSSNPWGASQRPGEFNTRTSLPDRLRLLVDGTTGQVVP